MAEDKQQDQNTQPEQNDSESRKRPRNPRRSKAVRLVVLALIVVGVIAAIPIYAYYSVRESTDDAQVDGHLVPISPRITGTIISVLVNDNQSVKAGQELVRLDPADYQVALEQAEAQLATRAGEHLESSVNVPLTTINTRTQISTSSYPGAGEWRRVASAQQGADTARAKIGFREFKLWPAGSRISENEKDLARFKDLVEKDEISKQDYDAAEAADRASAAAVQSAEADMTACPAHLAASG